MCTDFITPHSTRSLSTPFNTFGLVQVSEAARGRGAVTSRNRQSAICLTEVTLQSVSLHGGYHLVMGLHAVTCCA